MTVRCGDYVLLYFPSKKDQNHRDENHRDANHVLEHKFSQVKPNGCDKCLQKSTWPQNPNQSGASWGVFMGFPHLDVWGFHGKRNEKGFSRMSLTLTALADQCVHCKILLITPTLHFEMQEPLWILNTADCLPYPENVISRSKSNRKANL